MRTTPSGDGPGSPDGRSQPAQIENQAADRPQPVKEYIQPAEAPEDPVYAGQNVAEGDLPGFMAFNKSKMIGIGLELLLTLVFLKLVTSIRKNQLAAFNQRESGLAGVLS